MKFAIALLFLLGLNINPASAQKKYLALKDAPFETSLTGFYIDDVLDNRPQTDSIGFERLGAYGRKVPIDLAGGVPAALYQYLEQALPRREGALPIIVGVDSLEVKEEPPGQGGRATALLHTSFYKKDRWKFVLIHKAQALVFDSTGLPTEALVRQAVEQVVWSFSQAEWESASTEQTLPAESLKDAPAGKPSSKSRLHILTAGPAWGAQSQGWSLHYYYYGSPIPDANGWFMPKQVMIERYRLEERNLIEKRLVEARLQYLTLGISPFRKLSDRLYLKLSFLLLLGREDLTDQWGTEAINLLMGLAPAQGLYFIPENDYGLVFGLSLFEKLTTSEVYPWDIGAQLEVGFKF